MLKKSLAVLGILAMLFAVCACNQTGGEETTSTVNLPTEVNAYGLVGPTGAGFVNMMEKSSLGQTSMKYNVNLVTAPDAIVSKLTTGEADIAAIPTNLAASLYQKTNGGIQMIAINTECVLYFLENGNTIQSFDDFKGQTIYSTGEGSNPEYILRYLLTQKGIDPDKDVTLKFVAENEELAALLIKGEAKIALVPEPLCTTVQAKNQDLRIAVSVNEEWKAINSKSPLMGCLVATKAFIEKYPDALPVFLKEYKESIDGISDLNKSAELCEKYGIIASAEIAKKALPRCSITYIDGADMQPAIEDYFQVLFDANPKSVGGKMPDAGFYYTAA